MICVKFFAQDLSDKQNKTQSSQVYFNELSDDVLILIKTQRFHLEQRLPNYRIVCLISNEEITDDNNFARSI